MGRITTSVYKVYSDDEGNPHLYAEQTFICGNNKCANYKNVIGVEKVPLAVEEGEA